MSALPSSSAQAAREAVARQLRDLRKEAGLTVELVSAEVTVTQAAEVAQYAAAFDRLRNMAVYGADARALVVRAIEALDQPQG